MGKLIYMMLVFSLVYTSINGDDTDYGEPLFLSDFIVRGEYNLARNLSLVRHKEMEWLTSYSGYLTINKQLNSNMFFWFFPAKYNTSTAPLVLWLQGGPGLSSMIGLFTENGPFAIDADGSLKSRKYSWHLHHNLLYIDNPLGTGYSFSEYDAGYSKNQVDVGNNLYNVLQQFLTVFPELRANKFYITGESYAGKYVTSLGFTILKNTKFFNNRNKINLQGLAIASGFLDPVNMLSYGDVLYQNGMIDSNGLNIFKGYENDAVESIIKKDYSKALFHIDHLILNKYYKTDTVFTNLTGSVNYFNILQTGKYDFSVIDDFMNRPDVKKALNVGNIYYQSDEDNDSSPREEDRKVEFNLKRDIMQSVSGWLVELLKHYKVYLFNGQLDIICGPPQSENFLKNLNFDGAEEYKLADRHIWKVENEIAGYVKQVGRLTEVLVRNAGHFVAIDQPKYVYDIITKLTSGDGFRFN